MFSFPLPPRFFAPLASPGRDVYLDLLLRVFKETQESLGLVSRESALSCALEAIREDESFRTTDEIENEEPAFGYDSATDSPAAVRRGRAGAILRYLERCGWFVTEIQADFRQTFFLPEHSFRILKILEELVAKEGASLQGLVCSIHDLLAAAQNDGMGHIRVPEAFRQVSQLRTSLKELHHNIGKHLDQVVKQTETKAVLSHLFGSYRDEIVDKSYHQLRTTDHISRFRPTIVRACEELGEDAKLAQAVAYATASDKNLDGPLFKEQLKRMLFSLVDIFEGLDQVLDSIDVRHGQFVDTAISTIERLILNQATTSGHVHEALKALLNSTAEVQVHQEIMSIFDLFEPLFIDSLSPNIPRKQAQRFVQEHQARRKPSKKIIAEERAKTSDKLMRNIGREKIQLLAEALLAERESCLASEITLRGPEDLPIIIYLRDYGNGSLGYKASTVRPRQWLKVFGVGFYNFKISRV